MACGNKVSHNCSTKNYSVCLMYEGNIPDWSPLSEDDCHNLEETTSELYDQITKLKDQTDLSELGESCLTYVEDEDNKIIVKNVLLKYEEEICTLKEEIETLKTTAICDKDITQCVDTSGIVDSCSEPVTTLGQLLQFLVDQHKQ